MSKNRKRSEGLPSMGDFLEQYLEGFFEKAPHAERYVAARSYLKGLGDAIKELLLLSNIDRDRLLKKWCREYDSWLERQIEEPDIGWNASQQDPTKN